jgi:RHS repeat-associated protein
VAARAKGGVPYTFQADAANRLTSFRRPDTLTVAGFATNLAVSVTVNGVAAALTTNGDFVATGVPVVDGTNTFTAIAEDSYFRQATNVVSLYLPPTQNFSADANGNLLSDGERFFSYDAEDRLTNIVVSNAWRTTLAYDGLGRRRIRREYTWTNSAWRLANEVRYLYDGGLVVQERDSNNTPRLTYTRGLDLSGSVQGAGGIGGLLALSTQLSTNNPQRFFYHADGSGNVLALVDAAGSVQARYGYEPFGRLFWQSGPLTNLNRLRFASKEMHLSSGLYDFGARWYDPFLQRWLTEDPLGEAGGLNLYQFVGNDPLNRVDPWGWEDVLLYAREPLTAAEVKALGLATVEGLDWLWDQTQALLAEDYGVGPDGQPMLGGTPPGGALLSKAGKGVCKAARSAWDKMLKWAQARRAIKNPAGFVGKGIADPNGATFRMGRFDPKTGRTVFDDLGHFGQDVKGLSLVEKEGKVFWANDSISSPKMLTAEEIRAVESSLRQAFPNATIQQVKSIKDAFGL